MSPTWSFRKVNEGESKEVEQGPKGIKIETIGKGLVDSLGLSPGPTHPGRLHSVSCLVIRSKAREKRISCFLPPKVVTKR